MASVKNFKQQCPSCETMVPVRDPGLIGRKIDCPKCKYRFVVQEPADEDEAPAKKDAKVTTKAGGKGDAASKKPAAGKRGKDDAPPKNTKKKGGSNTLVLGVALAVLAVVALGFGAWALLGKGDGKSAQQKDGPPPPPPTIQPGEEQPPPVENKPGNVNPANLANITNLVPNDAKAIISYPIPRTYGSGLRSLTVEEGGAYSGGDQRFFNQFSFPINKLHRVISTLGGKGDRPWVFTILQTREPFKQDEVKKGLQLEAERKTKADAANKEHTWYLVKAELDPLATMLVTANQPQDTLGAFFYDNNTLVLASPGPMEAFLKADTKPALKTKPAGEDPGAGGGGNPPAGGGGMAGVPMGPPMAGGMIGGPQMAMMGGGGERGGGERGGRPGEQGGGMIGQPAGGGGGAEQGPPIPESYLTAQPNLKQLLDRLEKYEADKDNNKELSSILTFAGDMTTLGPVLSKFLTEQTNLPGEMRTLVKGVLGQFKTFGLGINRFDQEKVEVVWGGEAKNSTIAVAADELFQKSLKVGIDLAKDKAKMKLVMGNGTGAGLPMEGGNMVGGGFMIGGPGMIGAPNPGMFGGPNPGMMGGRPTPGMMGGGPNPGMMGVPSGPPAGGGRVGGGREGNPAGPGGEGGFMLGGGNQTGNNPGGNQPDPEADGVITPNRENFLLLYTAEVNFKEETRPIFDQLGDGLRERLHLIKSRSETFSKRQRIFDLAQALESYVKERKAFPPGAMPRPDVGRGLPYRPDERLSWAAALLPRFGVDYGDWNVNPAKAWNEDENLNTARRILPVLLLPEQPAGPGLPPAPSQPTVAYPAVPDGRVGATHYVAIAGVGLDAAEYSASDRKRGLFGYDRVTSKDEVTDGVDKTIAFLAVPGDLKAPWLAGGGATLRGVGDTEDPTPLAPFVCMTYRSEPGRKSPHDNKRGTLAIMGDGKVRFIPENLAPATFRALCTVNGGETIENLDQQCPVLKNPNERELQTGGIGPRPPVALTDRDRLQGFWKPVSGMKDGEAMPKDVKEGLRFRFSGDKVTVSGEGKTKAETMPFTLNPAKTPKEMDVLGPAKGEKTLCIYELTDRQLKLCLGDKEKGVRPTTFDGRSGSGQMLLVLERTSGGGGTVTSPIAGGKGVPKGWVEYTPPNKTYTVAFPGKVTEMKQSALGHEYQIAMVQSAKGGVFVSLGVEVPPGEVQQSGEAKLFDDIKTGMLGQLPGARVEKEKVVKFGDYPGREWTVSIQGKGSLTSRAYLAGDRLVLVQAGPIGVVPDADIQTFFNSLKLSAK